jgi:hypothetical protein
MKFTFTEKSLFVLMWTLLNCKMLCAPSGNTPVQPLCKMAAPALTLKSQVFASTLKRICCKCVGPCLAMMIFANA